MRKYEFIIGDIRKQFVIDKVKYVNISNNKDYWFYKRCIRFYTNKIEKTELFVEENNRIQILIDGKELTRHDEMIVIDHSFDFEDDLKRQNVGDVEADVIKAIANESADQ